MAALSPRQLAAPPAASASSNTTSTAVYVAAPVLATLSLVTMLLIIPPMIWHFRNRNMGATVLVAWVVILLLFNVVNAILWPSDDINTWYNGVGFCDIEVKIQIASQVALPASFACVLRALAAVMDTERTSLVQTRAQRRRNYAIDLSWCVGFPLLQMFLHYVVQQYRYFIYGVAGCVPSVTHSWLTIPLIVVPPALWVCVDAYYATLILIRLYRYRLTFNSILASSNTTKSRFMRLYILCVVWIVVYIPIEVYLIYTNAEVLSDKPYSWSQTHSHFDTIVLVPSGGEVFYDRWVWLGSGIAVFVFFGFGRDALNMYRAGLLALGLGRLFPSLKQEGRQNSVAATISSFNSKAKMLFKRKSSASTSTWTTDSEATGDRSTSDANSPKKTFLEAITEDPSTAETSLDEKHSNQDVRADTSTKNKQSILRRLTTLFRAGQLQAHPSFDMLPLATLSCERTAVHSAVTARSTTPPMLEVVVKKEVRQSSEHAQEVHGEANSNN